ncbi:NAD(P)H-dependent flavin oxidoreductase [Ruixingdingia sedimenti]|uniref:Nitronate monooxygenase n=1 Tax=Ruixingdingia sedimenti TaxID=3073604 RepID=A0ABU1FDL3_9RHOB|nr:nitronate monooxygenase [Xinfangfangia sp. LG-4]MDR5654643.1 nitronate monooxygenase [Xinfangfangia sp. LG-4]
MTPPLRTPLCDLLGCDVPVLLAGMGGVARWELAAAVAAAGGYPQLGMVREDPALIAREVTALRAAMPRPFAVNLIPAATEPGLLDRQIGTCLDLGVGAFSFFWDVVPAALARVKAAGAQVIHQVGTPEAARMAQDAGADVLVAQGAEAGGHVHGETGLLALVETVARAAWVPVVASGGIGTGAGLVAALAAGAQGVQCGTAFLATPESFAHDYHKDRVVAAHATDTLRTDIFVLNWPAHAAVRVIANSTTRPLGHRLTGHDPAALPREVIAQEDGRPILRYSTDSPLRTTTGDLEAMALFAGQGVDAITAVIPAGDRLRRIMAEAEAILTRLGTRP